MPVLFRCQNNLVCRARKSGTIREYSITGKPTPNVDGPAKVTGEVVYTIDMTLPNRLYGKLLRSPYPHAKLISIDTGQAQQLPGVKAIITGKDTPGGRYGLWRRFHEICDQECLATTKVPPGGIAEKPYSATLFWV